MKYTLNYFGEDKVFNTALELEAFIEEEHSDNPDNLNEIGEITDTEGNQYGFSWRAQLVEI